MRIHLGETAEAAPADPPPAWVRAAIEAIRSHLAGLPADLEAIPIDDAHVPEFQRRVLSAARHVRAGTTTTYGALAAQLGEPGAARAVGQALGRNPFPIVVPCHRVLAAGGRAGGFSAPGGLDTKAKILAIEGVTLGTPEDQLPLPMPLAAPAPAADRPALPYDAAEAVRVISAADPTMAKHIARVGPLRLDLDVIVDPFEGLLSAIVYQQLTGKAASTIKGRVIALCEGKATPAAITAVSDEALRGAGLSRAKLAAIRDLAEKMSSGALPSLEALRGLDDEAVIERLTAVRGVGRWTAEMFLIFRLGRPDVLPVDDYGVRKGYAHLYRRPELPTPEQLLRRGQRWRPFRSVASWYLWRAAEL